VERRQVAGEQVTFDRSGQAVLLTSRVVSRRLEESGDVHYLISWSPQGIRPDEWLPGREHRGRCKVPIRQLAPEVRARVEEQLFGRRGRRGRKQGCSRGPPPLT